MTQPVRAEYPSLEGYLRERLSPRDRERILFPSFNQWGFALATLADAALTARAMGSDITCAFWAEHTPLRDAGWTTSHRLSRLLSSQTVDMRVERALRASGVPAGAMAAPPIRSWRPAAPIDTSRAVNRSSIRDLTYRGSPMGRAILQVHPDDDTPVTDEHRWPARWVREAARSYAWAYDQTWALVEERGSTAVAVFNGRFLHDRAVMEVARAKGIPVLAYDMGGSETDFDLTTDETHDWAALQRRMLALYASWPEEERESLGSQWFLTRIEHADPQNAIFVESQQSGTGIDRSSLERVVVYFSSSGDEIAELELDWDAFFGGQGNAMRAVADACRALPGTSLVVRTHPHKRFKPARDVQDWKADVAAANPDVHLDEYSPVDSYALMRQADVVVTYGSTTGVEAAFAGKPVIVMGPSAYDILGCATPVSTVDELREALTTARVGDRTGALAWGVMMMRRGFRFTWVERVPGGYRLAGIDFVDATAPARHLGHLINRWRQRWLTAA